jgi:hypothetical protein
MGRRLTAVPATADDFEPTVLAELTAIHRLLERLLERLLQRRHLPPLTPSDRQLLDAIIIYVGPGVAFTAREIARHAAVVEGELSAALADAKVRDAIGLARRLVRLAKQDARLMRLGRDGDGVIWCLHLNDVG